MSHPVVHTEIRSQDPDATRTFFADLFGWKVASEGAFPGYTFIDTAAEDEVLFFVGVEDVAATLTKAEELGGKIIQPTQQVPGTTFGVFADIHGQVSRCRSKRLGARSRGPGLRLQVFVSVSVSFAKVHRRSRAIDRHGVQAPRTSRPLA